MADLVPFRVHVDEEVLADLAQRLQRTRLPAAGPPGSGWRRGTSTEYLAELLAYWRDDFDWRAQEASINRLPQFQMPAKSGPIHAVHVRSPHADATPLLLTHGWPWTFMDYAKLIAPLTNPTAFGAPASAAFHVVIPSLAGFGFSAPATAEIPAWWEMADLWVELMDSFGYARFGAAGGDWGAWVTAQLGHRHHERLTGIHLFDAARLELWGTDRPWDLFEPARAALAPAERAAFLAFERKAASHVCVQVLDPMTLAHGLTDSPAGLCSWLIERRRAWSDCDGDIESVFSKDELLTSVMIYWCTASIASSLAIYPSAVERPWQPSYPGWPVVRAPTALSTFPHHARRAGPWADSYYDLRWRRVHERGGHFAPAEAPLTVAGDLRDSFALFRNLDLSAKT